MLDLIDLRIGVHSIKVNAKEGTIEVKSEIDPQVLIEMAAKAGKRAQLLWESEPESSQNIPTLTPPLSPPPATSSTDLASQRQVQVSSSDHMVHLHDLVAKNARVIKITFKELIDKRVTKITFKEESHDDPSGHRSQDSPTPPIAPPSSDSKSNCSGGREDSGSGCCDNVEVVAAPAEPAYSIPPEFSDAPCNSKPVEPPVANVNCSNGGNRCRVM